MANEFRVKNGNVFTTAAGSRLIGFIAPTDEEFIVVDADDDRFPPSCQIIVSVNARRKNQRPGLSWRHRTAEIVSRLLRRWPN
jgi:hypothetical protein